MSTVAVEQQIGQLDRIRREARLWRIGGAIAILAIMGVSLGSIWNAVRGLTVAGPRQEEFTSELSASLQKDVVPSVQKIAAQTLSETRPQVEQEFNKIGGRMPELTQASLKEFETLQTNLSERGGKAVEETLVPMLEKKEDKIRQMFPEATEENVKALVTNLSDEAKTRAVSLNDGLFSKHMNAINGIVTNMETIRTSEKVEPGTEQTNWELGLAVFDVVRDDLRALEPKKAGTTTEPAAPAGPAKKEARL